MDKEILYYFIIIELIKKNKSFKKYACEDCGREFYSNKNIQYLKHPSCDNMCCEKIICPRGCLIEKDCFCNDYFKIKMNSKHHTFTCNKCNNNTYALVKWNNHTTTSNNNNYY